MTDHITPAQGFESPGAALAHYGKKGMKWGVRKDDKTGTIRRKPTSGDIHNARAKVGSKQRQINAQIDRANLATGAKQKQEIKKLSEMSAAFLKDPDRATALRMTRGEKFILGALAVGVPGVGPPASAAIATNLRLRRAAVESQQQNLAKSS